MHTDPAGLQSQPLWAIQPGPLLRSSHLLEANCKLRSNTLTPVNVQSQNTTGDGILLANFSAFLCHLLNRSASTWPCTDMSCSPKKSSAPNLQSCHSSNGTERNTIHQMAQRENNSSNPPCCLIHVMPRCHPILIRNECATPVATLTNHQIIKWRSTSIK